MVAKINHSSSLYGTLMYNQMKVNAAKAHIIFGHRMITDIHGCPEKSMQQVMMSFENYLFANKNTRKPILHISLNPSPEDKLTDGQYSELAKDYMQKLGYGDQPFVVYRHEDIDRHHIHIVSVNVTENGEKISDSYEWNRSMKICRELEQKYRLKQVGDKEKELDAVYLKKAEYGKGDLKRQISNILKTVASSYKYQSFGEYNALLQCFNINAKQVNGEYEGNPYNGIVYSVTDDDGNILSAPFKSSLFGKTFGYNALNKRMKRTSDDFKNGKLMPNIQNDIRKALQIAKNNRMVFVELMKNVGIDTVFRENEEGRIYGVTFVDHNNKAVFNGSRLSTGKEFSANAFNRIFNEPPAAPLTHSEIQTTLPENPHDESHHNRSDFIEEAFGIFDTGNNSG